MEDTVGLISGPKTLENHQDYDTYGHIALCVALQTLYTGMIKSNSWPAIADYIPQSNNASSRNVNYDGNQEAAQVPDTNVQNNETTPLPVEDSDNNVSPIALPPSILEVPQTSQS